MMQKLITVGNSKAFIVSREILKQVGDSEMVKSSFDASKKRLTVDFDQQDIIDSVIDPEVYQVAKNLLKRYDKAFAELARR